VDLFSSPALFALAQVLMINLVLSGDNAVVIGMVAARVAAAERARVIWWGMAAAVALRIGLALIAVDLLNILGLTLAGGVLLLWVAWRLYRDISESKEKKEHGAEHGDAGQRALTLNRAILRIAIADVSMSVDNVLAIAGAAKEHLAVLVIGLVLSIALMGVAANYVARLLHRYSWVSYVGVVLILYVAASMVWDGIGDVPEIIEKLT
jgi:YjbE family integral membrane protein